MLIKRPKPNQPRPGDARIVFQGEIFKIYQWQQPLFNGSEAIFEVASRADTVVVIPITASGKILILEQEQPGRPPFISFPGGRVEVGEDPGHTARRELQEETGYTTPKLVLLSAYQPQTKIDWAIYTFIAYGCVQKFAQTLDAGEKITAREVTFDEYLDLAVAGQFWNHEVTEMALRAKLDPRKMAELKKSFTPQ